MFDNDDNIANLLDIYNVKPVRKDIEKIIETAMISGIDGSYSQYDATNDILELLKNRIDKIDKKCYDDFEKEMCVLFRILLK